MRLRLWRPVMGLFFLGMLLSGRVAAQSDAAPILLHPRSTPSALPVATYRGLKVGDFRQLVKSAFEGAGFTQATVTTTKEGAARYHFMAAVPVDSQLHRIAVVVAADENADRNGRCAPCFLRLTTLPELAVLQKLPWLTQYELSSTLFPAIDQAYARIQRQGQAFMDASQGFSYRHQWQGERNLLENAFAGIDLPALQAATIEAYRAAGFVFVGDMSKDPAQGRSELVFSFPIDPDQASAGVVYKLSLWSQLDARGACATCEMREAYDPYQPLPPAGVSGMPARWTLESRFTAARALAFERLRDATARHLRPRTSFVVPPKPAPLGSPRPARAPIVVT